MTWPINDDLYVTGKTGLGIENPQERLEVDGKIKTTSLEASGIVQALSFQGDGSTLTGVVKNLDLAVKKAGDTMTGALTIQDNLTVNGNLLINQGIQSSFGSHLYLSKTDGSPGRGQWHINIAPNNALNFVESGIADYRLAITPGGNVGIGTPTPQGKLDVQGDIRAGNSDIYFTKIDHNHTGIGNTAGYAAIENAANYNALMILGRAGTDKGRYVGLWDYLQINGGLDVTGNVGIGTAAPTARLHIADSFRGNLKLLGISGVGHDFGYDGGSDGAFWFAHFGAETGNTTFRWDNGSSARDLLIIQNSGNVIGRFVQSSSKELKENIDPLSTQEAVQTLAKLNPVKFNYKTDPEKQQNIGFIAEDVSELLATADRKGVNIMDIVGVLTKVLQEQQTTISVLTEKIKALESQIQKSYQTEGEN